MRDNYNTRYDPCTEQQPLNAGVEIKKTAGENLIHYE